jgi:hypothetical protein
MADPRSIELARERSVKIGFGLREKKISNF